MRVVQVQKLGTRSARVYELDLAEVEKKLGQAQEERQVAQDEYKVHFFTLLYDSFIYDLFPFRWLYFVHKVALAKIDKLKQTKKEANHKLRNLRQIIARLNDQPGFTVVDLSEIDVPEEIADEDMRAELALLQLNKAVEVSGYDGLCTGLVKGDRNLQRLSSRHGQSLLPVNPNPRQPSRSLQPDEPLSQTLTPSRVLCPCSSRSNPCGRAAIPKRGKVS
jgi:hypothetical protein